MNLRALADERFTDPTFPEDCALLVAPPLCREAFECDVRAAQLDVPAPQARGDYAFQLARRSRHEGDLDAAWREDGAVVARLCLQAMSDARSVGVRVHEGDLSSLSNALRQNPRAVVIIAHWRGCRIAATDLRLDALPQTLDSLSRADPFERELRNLMTRFLDSAHGRPRAGVLADLLSRTICEEAGHSVPDDDIVELDTFMDHPERAALIGAVRDRVDCMLPNLVVPGNCIEFRDGYHKPDAIAAVFPEHWSGIVELSVCFSMVLARRIKQCRTDRRIITNERAKDPERCLPELRETFLRLTARKDNYAVVRAAVFCCYSSLTRGTGE
jgi:hypothetical protein